MCFNVSLYSDYPSVDTIRSMASITYVDKQVAGYAVNFIITSFTNPIPAKCTYNHKYTPANSDIPCNSIIDHKN